MTKFNVCAACVLEKKGVKTRLAVPHTCAKSDPNYKEPETKIFNQGRHDVATLPDGTYYRISIHKRIHETNKSTKYSIKRNQFLNCYKVPAGTAIWVPSWLHYMDEKIPSDPCIWVHEKYYKQLAFV